MYSSRFAARFLTMLVFIFLNSLGFNEFVFVLA